MRRGLLLGVLAAVSLYPQTPSQDQPYSIGKSNLPILIRSYTAPDIPPVRLNNSSRLHTLIRAGNLYLTVEDALALAIENNLNLEIARYGPLLAESASERAKAGGPIRGVPSASAQISSVNSGIGVNGSAASAGLGGGGGGGGTGGNGAATVQQIGAITPALDPSLQNITTFGHLTQPQTTTLQSQTTALVESVHTTSSSAIQRLISGGSIQFTDYYQYFKENSPTDILNPVVGPHMDLQVRHNFLQGFGTKLNDRGIRIAAVNISGSREVFRAQLLSLVAQVVNLYWDLAAAREDLKARQYALEITQQFVADTKYEISVGAIAGVELPRAEAELASRKMDVTISQDTLRNRAILLKEALSHTEDPELEAAEIIPVEHLSVPADDPLPPLRQLVATAMSKRPDVAVSKIRQETAEMDLPGTANPLLPVLQATGLTYNRGVAGEPQSGGNAYFIGGYGTALGQIFRRNFPTTQGNIVFSGTLGNRQNQADYGIAQLQFRQSQLSEQKNTNQIVVDISSQVAALQQARARYATAKDTRILQEQLLAAEKRRSSGTATFNAIMADQRQLIQAQLSEVSAMTAYAHTRVSLDQVLGETLERYNITLEEGLAGKVNRESKPLDIVEQAGKK